LQRRDSNRCEQTGQYREGSSAGSAGLWPAAKTQRIELRPAPAQPGPGLARPSRAFHGSMVIAQWEGIGNRGSEMMRSAANGVLEMTSAGICCPGRNWIETYGGWAHPSKCTRLLGQGSGSRPLGGNHDPPGYPHRCCDFSSRRRAGARARNDAAGLPCRCCCAERGDAGSARGTMQAMPWHELW